MEERHGHDEHVKLTDQTIKQINIEMDNLRLQQQTSESLRDSRGSSLHQPMLSSHNQLMRAAKGNHFSAIAPTTTIQIKGSAADRQSQSATQRYQSYV